MANENGNATIYLAKKSFYKKIVHFSTASMSCDPMLQNQCQIVLLHRLNFKGTFEE